MVKVSRYFIRCPLAWTRGEKFMSKLCYNAHAGKPKPRWNALGAPHDLAVKFSTKDDRQCIFTFVFSPIPIQSVPIPSHFHSKVWVIFPFSWDFYCVIPISIPFPNAYIKTMRWKCKQSIVEQQKTVPQKTGRQLLKTKHSETPFAVIWKSDENLSTAIL